MVSSVAIAGALNASSSCLQANTPPIQLPPLQQGRTNRSGEKERQWQP
jgi:hypothetical protein